MRLILLLVALVSPVVCTYQPPAQECPAVDACDPATFDGWCSNYVGLKDGVLTCNQEGRIDFSQCVVQ